MQYTYKIIYDIDKDMWNWRRGVESSFFGESNIKNISNDDDLKIAQQIVGLDEKSSFSILKPYLESQKTDNDSKLNKFLQIAENDFRDKFTKACRALEYITKRPMMSNSFIFYVTTFPRMPYFYEEREIFIYDSTDSFWGMPIDGFLHEGLHFQFIYYWQKDSLSPVSRLNEDKFDYLKEGLTVILDDELKPLISTPDNSYPSQLEFRKALHANWKEHHDFDKLVDFGLKILPDFVN